MKSITDRYWNIPFPYIPPKKDILLAKEFKVKPEVIKLLHNRGLSRREDIRSFLYPTLHDLETPFNMKGVDVACKIIHSAILDQRPLVIWGDYDVDGVTATSLLLRFFNKIGVHAQWFIPNRFTDGYGLNSRILRELIEKEKKRNPVIITVDCGIANHEEIVFAQSLGATVIVTDHHEPGDNPAVADVVINPKQRGCPFKDKEIAGVAIAFYLAMGLRAHLQKHGWFDSGLESPNLKTLLEFVAIGTIADMVPLKDSNRVLVKAGFEVINSSPSTGVAAMLKECDIHSGNITAEDIAFQIAPKINAAGRLSEASLAVELFIESDLTKAKKRAKKLTHLNNKRKDLCLDGLENTLAIVDMSIINGDKCCVLKTECSVGVLGIIASQIVEKLKCPTILVAEVDDKRLGKVLKGSCRSIPGINIFALLENCKDLLIHFGGHPMAAGITLLEENIETFTARLIDLIQKIPEKEPLAEEVDLEMDLEEALSQKSIEQWQLLEPFGLGNAKPIYIERNVSLQDIKKIGQNGDHLSFVKRGRYENKKCIAFRFGPYESILKDRPEFNMVYTISLSRYKRAEHWQAHLVDLL